MTKLSMTLVALAAGALLCGPAMAAQKQGRKAGLTAESKAKIKEIRKATKDQIRAVLTDAQKKVLDDAKGKDKTAHKAARQEVRKTLTADQKAKIKEIRQAARKQIREIRGVKADKGKSKKAGKAATA
ncbi:MAG: hypothetical protein LLG01_08605 [Planctomycetaceae bacterium]|nr:hypothetical protein [Planctomycetaceae bacterium]